MKNVLVTLFLISLASPVLAESTKKFVSCSGRVGRAEWVLVDPQRPNGGLMLATADLVKETPVLLKNSPDSPDFWTGQFRPVFKNTKTFAEIQVRLFSKRKDPQIQLQLLGSFLQTMENGKVKYLAEGEASFTSTDNWEWDYAGGSPLSLYNLDVKSQVRNSGKQDDEYVEAGVSKNAPVVANIKCKVLLAPPRP